MKGISWPCLSESSKSIHRNTKSDIPSSSLRTTLVIWMVGTTLLSARTQLPRPGTALMTQESVRFQTLQFKLLQPISCFTAANPFPYL